MTCDVWDTPYVNFDNGYPDMHMFPTSKPVALPWEPGVAFCMARPKAWTTSRFQSIPRNALVTQVERAKKMGFQVQVGTELEFYLLDPETKAAERRGYSGLFALHALPSWSMYSARSVSRSTNAAFPSSNRTQNMPPARSR